MTRPVARLGLLFFAQLLAPLSAAGSTIYPNALARGVGLAAAPECTVCHTTNRGGANTAEKPLAETLVSLGLEGGANSSALEAAIVAADTDGTDSDLGGAADIDELLLGTDPNSSADDSGEAGAPAGEWFDGAATGGCQLSGAAGFNAESESTGIAGWLGVGCALLVAARRPRRAHSSR